MQNSGEARINPKLAPRYYGSFEIVARIGVVAYRLHLSLLKKAIAIIGLKLSYPRVLNVTCT